MDPSTPDCSCSPQHPEAPLELLRSSPTACLGTARSAAPSPSPTKPGEHPSRNPWRLSSPRPHGQCHGQTDRPPAPGYAYQGDLLTCTGRMGSTGPSSPGK